MLNDKVPKEVQEEYFRGQKIMKKGEHYICTECHSEIPIKKACPICKVELDWDRIFLETRK
jgi:rubrerythrin